MKYQEFLESDRILLRPLELRDMRGDYVRWLNDPKVCAHNGHAIWPKRRSDYEEYIRASKGSRSTLVMAIVWKKRKLHVGNIALQSIDWIHRNAELTFLLGNSSYWGKGIGSEAGLLMLSLAFERLNLHRVGCGTFSDHQGMRKVAEKLGFREEGVRREAIFKEGRFVDLISYGLLQSEYQLEKRRAS